MKHRIFEFLVGLTFGIGLVISGLSDPSKVLGFLDLFGAWDPSLLFVMGGAVLVGAAAYAASRRRVTTVLGSPLQLPTYRAIDRRLVIGSLVFGVGWGLAGICPGPGLVLLGAGESKGLVFALAMMAGMLLFEVAERVAAQPSRAESAR